MADNSNNNAMQTLSLDASNEKTVRLDTRSGPVAAVLNLDFLELPDDLGLTVPQQGSPPGPRFAAQGSAQAPPRAAAAPAPIQNPNQAMDPMAANAPSSLTYLPPDAAHMTTDAVFGGVNSEQAGGHSRLLRMGLLFALSFLFVGGVIYFLNSMKIDPENVQNAAPPRSEVATLGQGATGEGVIDEEPSCVTSAFNMVMEALGLAEVPVPANPIPAKIPPKIPVKTSAADSEADSDADGVANLDVVVRDPYRVIANKIDEEALNVVNARRRAMSVTEDQGWSAGLDHKFPYQHYRAVDEMRAFRTSGSEALLRRALQDKRLWVRMNAAFALAESGVVLMASEVETAVGRTERRELLNGYFQRFTRSNNMAERYVLKFALPLVPDAARIDILQALVNGGDLDVELFAIAASFDNSRRVQRWATAWLTRHPSALLRMDEYREALDEFGLTETMRSGVALARAQVGAAAVAGGDVKQGRGGGGGSRRAFADREVGAPGRARLGAVQEAATNASARSAGGDGTAGAGEGTSVEFYRQLK